MGFFEHPRFILPTLKAGTKDTERRWDVCSTQVLSCRAQLHTHIHVTHAEASCRHHQAVLAKVLQISKGQSGIYLPSCR